MRLENWMIIAGGTPYSAPEQQFIRLCGNIYEDPRRPEEGHFVQTSRVVELDLEHKIAKTRTGSVYNLGQPDKGWFEYIRENYSSHYAKILKIWELTKK
jgi:hypothetical protein